MDDVNNLIQLLKPKLRGFDTCVDLILYSTSQVRETNSFKVVCVRKYDNILYDLVPFVQFKKREKHLLWSVTFSCRLLA